ncbi:uncharacterized protein SRS1_10141 [Sporisorium reilianum f. sp. reilianum]|uniref:CCHC-type domain-containing protein n=1 Tax=Sporisorium reilianum f. sp. reilianum TaxID=72559 RepID=A0A2N8U6Z2_9BASI|nr:uncharacterized protein SRS1_10141 [Sporisorium reilianum f. sp. reilianum]
MHASEVVATAQQAALSSVEQAANASGSSSKAGKRRDASTVKVNGASAQHADDEDVGDEGSNDDDEEGAYVEEGEAGEMSFVIDTAGDMDVDREIASEDEAKAENADTHVEAGLLLPSHVNVIPRSGNAAAPANGSAPGATRDAAIDLTDHADDDDLEGDMGDFEQLDMDPSTANRYYGAEEKAERRAKEQCLACGELGHDRRHCPHQHCLACGAMDDHPTRFCPMSTSCFRCGGMGHQTRTCPKPRRGPKSEECERCGSYSHVKALCPTLWRVYTYRSLEDLDRYRAKVFLKLQTTSKARDPRRDLEPDPAELSDSEDEFVRAGELELPTGSRASQFDPATRWCYNCSGSGNHWGDDCPEARCNPTRGAGEPSAFSEFVSRLGPFGKLLPGAPPLAGFQMPSAQFTFSVGSSATMHVAGDAVSGSSSGRGAPNGGASRRGQSGRDQGAGSGGLAIGRHFLSSPGGSRNSSPHASSSSLGLGRFARNGDEDGDDKLVSFDRTKAVACEGGGYLTPREKKGKKPLPEHLFRQWLRDRQDYPEHADEIRSAYEKRADLEAKGLDTKGVPSTRDIVGQRKDKSSKDRSSDRDSDRPSKRRRGDTASDPVVVDSDSDFRDDFSSASDSDADTRGGAGSKKRRGDGKNSRAKAVHTGWGHNGDSGGRGGGRGRKDGGAKAFKGGRFSSKRQEGKGHVYEASGGGGGGKKGRRGGGGGGGGSGGGGGGKGKRSGGGGGGGGEKVRGGGSKYRGSYF